MTQVPLSCGRPTYGRGLQNPAIGFTPPGLLKYALWRDNMGGLKCGEGKATLLYSQNFMSHNSIDEI
jgi:hypothetical protein